MAPSPSSHCRQPAHSCCPGSTTLYAVALASLAMAGLLSLTGPSLERGPCWSLQDRPPWCAWWRTFPGAKKKHPITWGPLGESSNVSEVRLRARAKYSDRLGRLEKYCSGRRRRRDDLMFKYPLSKQYWMYSKRHRFLLCLNVKAGSTSLIYKLRELAQSDRGPKRRARIEGLDRHKLMKRHYSLPDLSDGASAAALLTSFKFAFFRHPFEHVSSAYCMFYHGSDGLRKNAHLGAVYEVNGLRPHSLPMTPELMARFVWAVSSGLGAQALPNHLIPYSRFCDPCWVRFDAVGDAGTYQEDSDFVLNSLGVLESVSGDVVKAKNNNSEEECGFKYFYSHLTRESVTRLHDVYRDDFEMLGYDPSEALELATK